MVDVTLEMSKLNDKLDAVRSLFYDLLSLSDEDTDRRSEVKQSLYYAVNDLKNYSDTL